jgi:hypothetical protein
VRELSVSTMILELLVQEAVDAATSLGWDRALLRYATDTRRGVLRINQLTEETVCLGRYTLAPPRQRDTGVAVTRRRSGGRVAPAGPGFLGVSLSLPHRSALVSDDPLALAPDQVLNRCVRGLLEALRLAGVDAFYPGRDLVTAAGRPLAVVSFDVDAGGVGALLCEAIVAVERDLSALPHLVDRVDPGGVVRVPMMLPDDVTSVGRIAGRVPDLPAWAGLLRRGWEAAKLDVAFAPYAGPREAAAVDAPAWLLARAPRPELERRATAATMLGALDVHLGLAADGRIADAMLAGDFIAPAAAVDDVERGLRGCRPQRGAIEAVVARAFAGPERFILGVGPLSAVTDAVLRAAAP